MIFVEGKYFNYKIFNFSKFLKGIFFLNSTLLNDTFFDQLVKTDYFNFGLVYLDIDEELK